MVRKALVAIVETTQPSQQIPTAPSGTGDGSSYGQETVRHTKDKQYLTPKE